jgi:hypothetical protein
MKLKYIRLGLIVLLFLIFLNFAIFIFVFRHQRLSHNISDWASFADYIGGTTNVLVSIMTLLVTLYIAYEIAQLEDKRNLANIQYDKRKFKRELREKEYSIISESLESVWSAVTNVDRKASEVHLYAIRQRFMSFIKYKYYLFPEINAKDFQKLDNTLIELMKLPSQNLEVDSQKSIELIQTFVKEVNLFHRKIQEYMTSE